MFLPHHHDSCFSIRPCHAVRTAFSFTQKLLLLPPSNSLLLLRFVHLCTVLSCLVLSYLVLSCLVLSCLVLSCLVLFCLVLSCLVLSGLVLPCLVLSCLGLVLPCLALSCLVLVLSCLVMSYRVLTCLSSSGPVTQCSIRADKSDSSYSHLYFTVTVPWIHRPNFASFHPSYGNTFLFHPSHVESTRQIALTPSHKATARFSFFYTVFCWWKSPALLRIYIYIRITLHFITALIASIEKWITYLSFPVTFFKQIIRARRSRGKERGHSHRRMGTRECRYFCFCFERSVLGECCSL